MSNNRQDYLTNSAIRDADASVSAAKEAVREVDRLIGKQQPVKEYFVNSSPSQGGNMNPLDYTLPGMAVNAVKGVLGGQQPQQDDFNQRLTQEYQRARSTPGLENYARDIEKVAQFRAQGMGGAMEGSQLANAAMDQESQLRANQEYQMGQQQKAMEWATNLKRNMDRDTSNQNYAQQVGMTRLNQDYGREQNVRQLKADQAKSLLDSYVTGRQQAMNFAQGAFRSLI